MKKKQSLLSLRKAHMLFATLACSLLGACGGSGSGEVAVAPPPPPPPPAGTRYVDRIFDNVDEMPDVLFGQGTRSVGVQDLFMDIFEPTGDDETNRPLVIVAHGGAFITGTRKDDDIRQFAMDFARRGFVTASISYRFFEQQPATEQDAEVAVVQAFHDMNAAIRFFREDAATQMNYRIDTDSVFVAGISAGGVLASVAATIDGTDTLSQELQDYLNATGGLGGDSSANVQFPFDVAGAISISGGITDLTWIDSASLPLYAAHEEFDPVVPCREDITNVVGIPITLAGGCDMIPAMEAAGVQSMLYLVENVSTHVGYTDGEFEEILNESAEFIASLLP